PQQRAAQRPNPTGPLNSSIRPCEQRRHTGLSEVLMAYGFDRFLTTHTGSLPRPDDLIRAMFAKEEGVPVDRATLAARISTAVAEVVRKQAAAGVDLVNDGEMSKPSYATYVKDRLTGFGGSSNTFVYPGPRGVPQLGEGGVGCPRAAAPETPRLHGPDRGWRPGRATRRHRKPESGPHRG